MVEARGDKRFDFARRHFKGLFNTLNAESAIFRARQLVDDIKEMKLVITASAHQDPWHRFEFPNYYIVGLVTCLEWHARSRLHDLLRYDPKNFTSDDVRQAVSGSKLEQLLQEQLTVAQLVAASTLVSDFHKYIGIFDRLLEYIGASSNAADIIKVGTMDPGAFFARLEGLFARRHVLVHEIDETQIGGWNVRESASLDEVEELGQSVIDIMNRLERAIAKFAKGDFPNLIYSETQKTRSELLLEMITEIEETLIDNLKNSENMSSELPRIQKSIEFSRQQLSIDMEMMIGLHYPGRNHYDLVTPLINMLYEGRLAYIARLSKELNESGAL